MEEELRKSFTKVGEVEEKYDDRKKTIGIQGLMNLGIDLNEIEIGTAEEECTTELMLIKQKKEVLISETDVIKKGFMKKKTYAKYLIYVNTYYKVADKIFPAKEWLFVLVQKRRIFDISKFCRA